MLHHTQSLPHAVDAGSPERPSAAAPPAVLIVDDEAMIRELATRTLERGGFRVLTAAHGKAAIEALEAHGAEIGLVLLDLTMPGLSGEQTLAIIRARWPGIRIMVSSGQNSESTGQLQAQGLITFIEKPYLPYELLTAVREAFAV